MSAAIATVAVLGTGIMGRPMAANLLKAGFAVRVWNRSRAKAEPLGEEGAAVCETPAEAVAGAGAVITMVTDGTAVTDLLFRQGAADAASPGTIFIDMSSIQPSLAKDHAARLASRRLGSLDAPVSGGEPGAIAGTLAIMVGGDAADFGRAEPLFSAMGKATYVGPSGSGQLTKLANQAIVAVTIQAVSEGLLLAAAGGADPAAVREAIGGGFCQSRILEVHGQRMIERDFNPGGRCAIHLKDMNNVLEVASELNLDLPLTHQVRDAFAAIVDEMNGADFDHSALLLLLEAMNAPARVGDASDRLPT